MLTILLHPHMIPEPIVVPFDDVVQAFEELQDSLKDLATVLDYFEDMYI